MKFPAALLLLALAAPGRGTSIEWMSPQALLDQSDLVALVDVGEIHETATPEGVRLWTAKAKIRELVKRGDAPMTAEQPDEIVLWSLDVNADAPVTGLSYPLESGPAFVCVKLHGAWKYTPYHLLSFQHVGADGTILWPARDSYSTDGEPACEKTPVEKVIAGLRHRMLPIDPAPVTRESRLPAEPARFMLGGKSMKIPAIPAAVLSVLLAILPKLPAQQQKFPPGYGPAHAVTPELKDENRHKEFLARIKEGPVKLLFLGDSITDFWRNRGQSVWANFEKYQPANFGVSGDRTEHVLWRLNHGELDGINPDVTVIMIGTNNIGNVVADKPEWAAAGVRKIVDTVHQKLPRTKILLLAVFPRDRKDSEKRRLVDEINKRISQLGDRSYVEYLDIGKVFLDENGEIPPDVMPDGLHPSEKGYQLWYDAMSPTLESMMAR